MRRLSVPSGTSNLSYRLRRCCLTAASVTTSSAAISRTEAGIATGQLGCQRAAQGREHVALAPCELRHRSRRGSDAFHRVALLGRTLPGGKVTLTSGVIPRLGVSLVRSPRSRDLPAGHDEEHRDAARSDRHVPADRRNVRRPVPDRSRRPEASPTSIVRCPGSSPSRSPTSATERTARSPSGRPPRRPKRRRPRRAPGSRRTSPTWGISPRTKPVGWASSSANWVPSRRDASRARLGPDGVSVDRSAWAGPGRIAAVTTGSAAT